VDGRNSQGGLLMGLRVYDSSGREKINSVQTVDTNLLAHPGFRLDYAASDDGYYLGQFHGGADAGSGHSNNVVYQPWYIPQEIKVNAYSINGDDAGNTGVLAVGMYENSNGLPTTLIDGTSASMTGNGTGDTAVTVDFTLTAGWKWMASVETSGSIDLEQSYMPNYAFTAHIVTRAVSNYGGDWGTYGESGSALPAEATIAASVISSVPRIGMRFVTA
jgi:hypothetical protein